MVLLREIKRRRVLRTLSLYIVGCWVALQVVQLFAEGDMLPVATMRHLLIAMSAGFPLVLLTAWYFDISSEGITRTTPRPDDDELPDLTPGDHALLVGIIAVVALSIYGLSSPVAQDDDVTTTAGQTLAVLAFAGEGADAIGDAIAEELRTELRRFAAVRVLGPETSKAIQAAAGTGDDIANELGVTAVLTGDASLDDGVISVSARIRSLPAGNTVWSSDYASPVSKGPALHVEIANAVLDAIIPSARADATHDPRIDSEACENAYEYYLRGRQLVATGRRSRGQELLQQATQVAPGCGVAWAALARSRVDWTLEGFAKAGAAARRALEINDDLAEAWAVLAEIAEEEQRWSESERLFLKALYLDPANSHVNAMYAEALMTRGRERDSLHYALEAYRYDPVYRRANWQVGLSARYAGEADLLFKHGKIGIEMAISDAAKEGGWDDIAEAHILKGEVQDAARIIEEHGEHTASWYSQCVRSISDHSLREGLVPAMRETLRQSYAGELTEMQIWFQQWNVIRCAMFIEEPDLAIEILASEELPTELKFTAFFQVDAAVLRSTDHFRNLVVESGLLDYWKEWGWPDYCRPDGESFACD